MSTSENMKATLEAVTAEKPKGSFDWFRVLILSMGHLVNDSYSNIMPSLLLMLVKAYNMSGLASGILMTVYTFTSSVVQPVFGYYADKYGRRWLVALSVAWAALFMSLIGIVPYLGLNWPSTYTIILALIAMAGFGSASYHPQASSMVPRISGDHKGLGVSIFSAGGNLGYAVMLILMVPATALWGFKGTLIFMVPGLVMALLLYKYAPEAPSIGAHIRLEELIKDIRSVSKPLAAVTGVVCARAWIFFGLITFLPRYLVETNGETSTLAYLSLFVLLFFGAIGGLIGGFVSDRYGRKPVIVWSLLLTAPLMYLAFSTPGLFKWAMMAMAGMALLASFSPAVLIAQNLIPKNQGIASGIILGLAIGIGGIGVSFTGAIYDMFGPAAGIYSLAALPVFAVLLALVLPGSIMPIRR